MSLSNLMEFEKEVEMLKPIDEDKRLLIDVMLVDILGRVYHTSRLNADKSNHDWTRAIETNMDIILKHTKSLRAIIMECPECPECGGNERVKCKRCEKLVCSYCVEVGNHGEEGYCWECWDKLIVNDDDSYSFVDDAEVKDAAE